MARQDRDLQTFTELVSAVKGRSFPFFGIRRQAGCRRENEVGYTPMPRSVS